MEAPILCSVCLGDNPYIRMEKLQFGRKLCHFSNQAYQGFRWKPNNGRYKETVISPDVARERNICQCCLNDLKYGLPVGVRDNLLTHSDIPKIAAPTSLVGQMYHAANNATQDYASTLSFADHMQNVIPNTQLQQYADMKTAREKSSSISSTPFRNLPKLCSFWLGGQCRRAATGRCPFRPCDGTFVFPEIARDKEMHARLVKLLNDDGVVKVQISMDKDIRDTLKKAIKGNSTENIKKRVRGDDKDSQRVLEIIQEAKEKLPPPLDITISTLWVGGITDSIAEQDIFNAFYIYGTIVSINISRSSKCAFVKFESRRCAEAAVSGLYQRLCVNGQMLTLNWAKPSVSSTSHQLCAMPHIGFVMLPPPGYEGYSLDNIGGLSNIGGILEEEGGGKRMRANTPRVPISYPSMDPSRLGGASV